MDFVVTIESSLESSGRGRGGVASDSDEGSRYEDSSSSGSIFYDAPTPEGSPPAEEVPLAEAIPESGRTVAPPGTELPAADADRIFYGTPLFLSRGGIVVDPVPLSPVGGLPVPEGYD